MTKKINFVRDYIKKPTSKKESEKINPLHMLHCCDSMDEFHSLQLKNPIQQLILSTNEIADLTSTIKENPFYFTYKGNFFNQLTNTGVDIITSSSFCKFSNNGTIILPTPNFTIENILVQTHNLELEYKSKNELMKCEVGQTLYDNHSIRGFDNFEIEFSKDYISTDSNEYYPFHLISEFFQNKLTLSTSIYKDLEDITYVTRACQKIFYVIPPIKLKSSF